MRYTVGSASRVAVELRTRDAAPSGLFRLTRGEVSLAPDELAGARGEISVDLGTLVMHGEDSLEQQRYTAQAQDWLDIGASRPEAERSRLRWARFTLSDLSELSAATARAGRASKTRPRFDKNAPALLTLQDGGSEAPEPEPGEFRTVDCVARGQLTVHGFKADYAAAVSVSFEYVGDISPSSTPVRVVIQSRRPLVVPLKAHDVKPRDSTGVFIARDLSLLGTKVANEARVWVDLILEAAH